MSAIRVLDEKTVSKIAAGEVIERPLSVIKELVENAIDAAATEIAVEIQEGGHRLIRVSDNGCGMGPDDCRLAIESHTTSKLADIADLDSLATLGFRGEALHSIAAVSHLTATSRRRQDEVGVCLRVEGGKIISEEPAARNPGTTVEVENLFYNIPARQKFLKTSRAEVQAISNFLSRVFIAYPEISFRFAHNDVDVFRIEPAESPMERIHAQMGREVSGAIEEARGNLKRVGIHAIFTRPDFTFPNRRFQTYFVNRRLVKDRSITIAVDTAYKGLIPSGRYPMCIMLLAVPPDEVDVNVHPAKTEVRFLHEHEIHSLIYRTIRSSFVEPLKVESEPPLKLVSPQAKISPPPLLQPHPPAVQRELKLESAPPLLVPDAEADDKQRVEIYDQFYDTFIFATVNGQPVIIDQHIASERIMYNRLKRASADAPSQRLLISEPVEVPHYVFSVLNDNLDAINSTGIEIESFGDRAFVIRSVVHNAGAYDPLSLLTTLANEITAAPFKAPDNVIQDKLITVVACKMAIQGGQKLSREEMKALVEEYLTEEFNRTCPHGRPIMFELSREALNSWFKR
ncbi:MAG: DNA mismatch repair endonuclease MutL [bacterium]